MPWDLTSPESVNVPSTASVNIDRVVPARLIIDFNRKRIILDLDRGAANGASIDKKDTVLYHPSEASYDAIMAAVTNNGETLGDALERILLGQANTDEDLPAGSIS
jgi:hypothetical protein